MTASSAFTAGQVPPDEIENGIALIKWVKRLTPEAWSKCLRNYSLMREQEQIGHSRIVPTKVQ